jgi:hypothetical protein
MLQLHSTTQSEAASPPHVSKHSSHQRFQSAEHFETGFVTQHEL